MFTEKLHFSQKIPLTNLVSTEYLRKNGLPFSMRQTYINSLNRVKKQPVDVFLGNHTDNNNTVEKLKKGGDAFVCPEEWESFIDAKISYMEQVMSAEKENAKKLEEIKKNKVIAIIRGIAEKDVIPTVQALLDGGIKAVEFTFDPSGRIPDSEVRKYIESAVARFKGKVLVGAGTVLNKNQVSLVKQAGGEFIISPNTDTEVIKRTKDLGMLSFPGAFTPSEAVVAYNAGADIIKVFPAVTLGADFIKNIKAPLSHIDFMAVGGINAENAGIYLASGASCIGVGSNIVNKSLISAGDFDGITRLAKGITERI